MWRVGPRNGSRGEWGPGITHVESGSSSHGEWGPRNSSRGEWGQLTWRVRPMEE